MKFLSEWETSLQEISKLEKRFNESLINRYNESFSQLIIYLEQFFRGNNFDAIKKSNKGISGCYDNERIKITFTFNEPIPSIENHALFTIIKNSVRNDFRIIIKPAEKLYVPSIANSAFRPKPRSRSEADNYIKKIEDEYFQLSQKEKQLCQYTFSFSYCVDRDNIDEEMISKLDKFTDVKSLFNKILNFEEIVQ